MGVTPLTFDGYAIKTVKLRQSQIWSQGTVRFPRHKGLTVHHLTCSNAICLALESTTIPHVFDAWTEVGVVLQSPTGVLQFQWCRWVRYPAVFCREWEISGMFNRLPVLCFWVTVFGAWHGARRASIFIGTLRRRGRPTEIHFDWCHWYPFMYFMVGHQLLPADGKIG